MHTITKNITTITIYNLIITLPIYRLIITITIVLSSWELEGDGRRPPMNGWLLESILGSSLIYRQKAPRQHLKYNLEIHFYFYSSQHSKHAGFAFALLN